MDLLAIAVVMLLPLTIAPGLFSYFDITPKLVELYLFAAAAILVTAFRPRAALAFACAARARWFAALIGLWIALLLSSAALSPDPELAWQGSTWRHFDAVAQSLILLLAFLIAGAVTGTRRVLTAVSIAGILASVYAIGQYFGIDPFLPPESYRAGDGAFRIVRPPGTLAHSGYFAAWLLWPALAGLELRSKLGAAAAVLSAAAIVLTGSRAALLGLLAGLAIVALRVRPPKRVIAGVAAAAAVLLVAFYLSPAGAAMRARAHWIRQDSLGGARLLLWRDSLRMAADRPLAGFGPDAFVAEFPQYQSVALSRAYPDFYHESPHNIFLDALDAQGIPGLLVLGALAVLGLSRDGPTRAGLAATVIAHQFTVFDLTNALMFVLGVGLAMREEPEPGRRTVRIVPHAALAAVCLCLAALIAVRGWRIMHDDRALLQAHSPVAPRAALRLSRVWANQAAASSDDGLRRRYADLALQAAVAATRWPEQRANAWYNLAFFAAARNDVVTTEAGLRAAIRYAPHWFKPHWALARLLASTGRPREAAGEAVIAMDLDGGKDAEVTVTMSELIRSPGRRVDIQPSGE